MDNQSLRCVAQVFYIDRLRDDFKQVLSDQSAFFISEFKTLFRQMLKELPENSDIEKDGRISKILANDNIGLLHINIPEFEDKNAVTHDKIVILMGLIMDEEDNFNDIGGPIERVLRKHFTPKLKSLINSLFYSLMQKNPQLHEKLGERLTCFDLTDIQLFANDKAILFCPAFYLQDFFEHNINRIVEGICEDSCKFFKDREFYVEKKERDERNEWVIKSYEESKKRRKNHE